MTAAVPESYEPIPVRALKALLLWVPYERTPRFLAFGLIMLRQVTLPFVLLIVLLLPFSNALPKHQTLALVIGLGSFVVFEELGRYSFIRRADRPLVAVVVFTAMIILTESALYYRSDWTPLHNLLMRAPSWGLHVAAGAALYLALKHRRYLALTLSGVIIAHTAFNVLTAEWLSSVPKSGMPGLVSPHTVSSASAIHALAGR